MRKEDMSAPAVILEAFIILLGLCYMGLEIFYGVTYHVPFHKFFFNIVALLLVYLALTLLTVYPERVNRLPQEAFTPDIRKLTLRMLRIIKLVFVAGLLIPCLFDAFGIELVDAMSLIVVGCILLVAFYYEYRIIKILKNRR